MNSCTCGVNCCAKLDTQAKTTRKALSKRRIRAAKFIAKTETDRLKITGMLSMMLGQAARNKVVFLPVRNRHTLLGGFFAVQSHGKKDFELPQTR
jgi:hypothetical protein